MNNQFTQEVTQWFDGHAKPALPGWYECQSMGGRIEGRRWYWDGEVWRGHPNGYELIHQDRVWRGLTKPAN